MPRPPWISSLPGPPSIRSAAVGGDQLVVARAAIDEIVAAEGAHQVVAATRPDLVVAALVVHRHGIREDLVAAAGPFDPIIAGTADDPLAGTACAGQGIERPVDDVVDTHRFLPLP